MQTTQFDKISPTALLVAYARQFSDIPYTTELAELVNAQATVDQFAQSGIQDFLHIGALIEARYKSIDRVIQHFGGTQFIELAAGLLPRGIVMTQNPGITFVESDLPAMINIKQSIISQLIEPRPNLHFVAIDATHTPNPLLLNVWRDTQPVYVLCEGLLAYLTFAEKEKVFRNVRELLLRQGGVWITPDLYTKKRQLMMQRVNSTAQSFVQAVATSTGRSPIDNSFEDQSHIQAFVAAQGFQIEQFSTLIVMDELTSLEKLGLKHDAVRPLLEAMPVFALTPMI